MSVEVQRQRRIRFFRPDYTSFNIPVCRILNATKNKSTSQLLSAVEIDIQENDNSSVSHYLVNTKETVLISNY